MNINKAIVIFVYAILLVSCKAKSQDKQRFWLDEVNAKLVLKNIECREKIVLAESENIDTFVNQLKENYSGKFEKIVLMFYVESGEVTSFYSIGILLPNSSEAEISIYTDELIKSKSVSNFDAGEFYHYLSSIEEEDMFVQKKMLVIDVEKNDIKCTTYNNIKKEKSQQLKNLTFVD